MSLVSATFAVVAEKEGYSKSLYLHGLTFERVMDEIVTPYETNKAFYIDGVPVKRDNLLRLKVVQQSPRFERALSDLHHFLRLGRASSKGVSAADYPTRLDAIFRAEGTDVTSYLLRAFDVALRKKLKGAVTENSEALAAAARVFGELLRAVSGAG